MWKGVRWLDCLLCGESVSRFATWTGLFTDRNKPVVCKGCREEWVPPDNQPSMANWRGTEYEGMLDGANALFAYNDPMKELLHRYKFLKDVSLALVFANEIKRAEMFRNRVAVPIPMHPERLRERTFPHVEEMLIRAGIPYSNLLEKTAGHTLGKMNRKERMASDLLFRLSEDAEVKEADYLLVDDLYTTGTTLHHAALVLKEAGAASVTALTLIRA